MFSCSVCVVSSCLMRDNGCRFYLPTLTFGFILSARMRFARSKRSWLCVVRFSRAGVNLRSASRAAIVCWPLDMVAWVAKQSCDVVFCSSHVRTCMVIVMISTCRQNFYDIFPIFFAPAVWADKSWVIRWLAAVLFVGETSTLAKIRRASISRFSWTNFCLPHVLSSFGKVFYFVQYFNLIFGVLKNGNHA